MKFKNFPALTFASYGLIYFYFAKGYELYALCIILILHFISLASSHQLVKKFLTGSLPIGLIAFFPIYLLIHQYTQYILNLQGIDFAIFTQVIHQVSITGKMNSSLIDIFWHNFLAHHFSPIFYILGLINRIANNAALTISLAGALSIGLTLILIYKIALSKLKEQTLAIAICTVLILLPAFHVGTLWEVRDEILGIPVLLYAYYCWCHQHHKKAALSLFTGMIFKENYFLFICYIASIFFIIDLVKNRKIHYFYLGLIVVSSSAFLIYMQFVDFVLIKRTFSTFNRIISVADFFTLDHLIKKTVWLGSVIAPIVIIVFLTALINLYNNNYKLKPIKLAWLIKIILISAPFFGLILISKFPAMYYPYCYYSVLPTVASVLCLIIFMEESRTKGFLPICTALVFCLLIRPNQHTINQVSTALYRLQNSEKDPFRNIPKSASIIASDFATAKFVENRRVTRLFHANKSQPRFDYIVIDKNPPQGSRDRASLWLRSWSNICYENRRWQIRCAYNSVRVTAPSRDALRASHPNL